MSTKVVVFKDIDYSELVRVEMRRPRKIGENPVLASVEFEVKDARMVYAAPAVVTVSLSLSLLMCACACRSSQTSVASPVDPRRFPFVPVLPTRGSTSSFSFAPDPALRSYACVRAYPVSCHALLELSISCHILLCNHVRKSSQSRCTTLWDSASRMERPSSSSSAIERARDTG